MRRSQSRAWAIFLGAVLSACGGAADQSPSVLQPESPAEASATVSPSASPSPRPTQGPQATPSATLAPTGFRTAFQPDEIVETWVDGLRIRSEPGLSGTELGTLARGYESLVLDGPEVRDGLVWYLIAGLGLPPASGCMTGPDPYHPFMCPVWWGWAAWEGADHSTWLERTGSDCADPAGPLDDFAYQEQFRYIPCYGSTMLTLHGVLTVHVGTPVGDDPCADVPAEIRWLACTGQYTLASSRDVVGMVMALPPGRGLPDQGELIVEGHFDDPASEACAFGEIPDWNVLNCRATFVVTAAASAASP